MNKTPCGECVHYDPREKFTPLGPQPASYGWCAKKSVYPHKAPDGMVIPEGAQRADSDAAVCAPVIVRPKTVVPACTDMVRK